MARWIDASALFDEDAPRLTVVPRLPVVDWASSWRGHTWHQLIAESSLTKCGRVLTDDWEREHSPQCPGEPCRFCERVIRQEWQRRGRVRR